MDEEDLWAEYARVSKTADSDRLDDRAWGADEALDEILCRIEHKREIKPDAVANLVRNRARKHRKRRLILARNVILIPRRAANEEERQHALHLMRRSAAVLTTFESRLLFAVAEGHSYGELAGRIGAPAATLKTWVRRARLKLPH